MWRYTEIFWKKKRKQENKKNLKTKLRKIYITYILVAKRMNKEVLKSGDIDFKKHKYHHTKYPLGIRNVDFDNKIMTFIHDIKKVFFDKKN